MADDSDENAPDDSIFESAPAEDAGDQIVGSGAFKIGRDSGFGNDQLGRGTGLPRGAGDDLKRKVRNLQASGLDVVVLLDATGSMDSEIEAAKNHVGLMIATLQALGIEFRLGVVAFRDRGEDYIVKSESLTSRLYKSVDFLDSLSAAGGGDTPEAVLDAFQAAIKMRFSRKAEKILILVGDAPPKPQTESAVLTPRQPLR